MATKKRMFRAVQERQPDGRTVKVWTSGRYRYWQDDDVEYGKWAASVEQLREGGELILGHTDTRADARQLCLDHMEEQG